MAGAGQTSPSSVAIGDSVVAPGKSQIRLTCVGTHHKTGTIWMRRVFAKASEKIGLPRNWINKPKAEKRIPETGRVLLVSWESAFSQELLSRPDVRGLHMIRDPRDVLISGARYHQVCGVAGERPIHKPREELGGLSYQQHLRNIPDVDDQLLFEMENIHLKTLNEMTSWRYDNPNIWEIKYEDLILDTDCSIFSQILDFLGWAGDEKQVFMDCYWNNSLFGGLSKKSGHSGKLSKHIQSGANAQWMTKLPRSVAEVYADRHGDALIHLGYETDNSWVEKCPDVVPPLISEK